MGKFIECASTFPTCHDGCTCRRAAPALVESLSQGQRHSNWKAVQLVLRPTLQYAQQDFGNPNQGHTCPLKYEASGIPRNPSYRYLQRVAAYCEVPCTR